MSQKQEEENPAEETGEEKQVRKRGGTGVAARAEYAPAAADWPPLPQAVQGLATTNVARAAFRRDLVP